MESKAAVTLWDRVVGAQAPRRGFVGCLPMSAGCVIPQIVRHIATSPFPGDCFLSVASRTFEEPFVSVFWTPEDGAELVLLHVTEDMVWVREYFEPSVNPGGGSACSANWCRSHSLPG